MTRAAALPRLPAAQAWLLGWTVAAALLWRRLPPAPPWLLLALPPLLAWPNARRALGGLRLGAALLLLFLVLHARSPGSPAARPQAGPLADGARALLLRPLPQPALGLAALLEPPGEEGATRLAQSCAAWQLTTRGWRALPGRLALWPGRDGETAPTDSLLLLAPRGAGPLQAALWRPLRGPIGPFSDSQAEQGWRRGELGSLSLDRRRLAACMLPDPPPSAWRRGWERLEGSLAELRAACARRLERGSGEGGPWLVAILLGEQRVLPPVDVRVWQETGLAHLLAVSGLNVGVLALALGAALAPLPRSWRDPPLVLLLLLYVPLAGWQVSVRRAVLMALLLLAARRLGRRTGVLSALALAALWILWCEPGQLAAPGFLMSFGAVAALALGMGTRRRAAEPGGRLRRWARGAARGLGDALRVTVLAQLGTVLPQLACFGALPLSGLLLNLAAVPLSSLLTVAGFLHLLLPLPGEPLGELCRVLARLLVVLARATPAAALVWSPHPAQLALLGAACALLLLPLARRRLRLALAALALLVATDLLPRLAPKRAFACLFDVGQGDALLLGSRAGAVLVDAGWSNPLTTDTRGAQLAQAVSRLWPGGLDWLVLTHPDQDHLGGAAGLLKSLPAERLLWNGEWRDNEPQRRLRLLLDRSRMPLVPARPGQLLQAGLGWRVRALGPPPPWACPAGNERSIVLRVEAPAGTLLLTGDAGLEEEAWLARWGPLLQADWLKAGHHGSRGSTGADFLARVRPREAWISCGRGNSYGHPHPELLERLRRAGLPWRRSDEQGWLWLSMDGGPGPRRAWPRPGWRWRPAHGNGD